MIGKQPLDNGFRQDIDLAIPITTDDLLSSHIGFTVKLPVIEVRNRVIQSKEPKEPRRKHVKAGSHTKCRDNCEVISSTVCTTCRESNAKRRMERLHSLSEYSADRSSDIAVIARLQQYFPSLSQMDVRRKVAAGQISSYRNAVPLEIQQRRNAMQQLAEIRKLNNVPLVHQSNQHYFYTDIHDLRQKIRLGEIPRSYGPKPKPSIMDTLFPSFISTTVFDQCYESGSKKIARLSDPYFEPPLLPLDNQNPPNSFFAGQEAQYIMPTPLPLNPRYLRAIDSRQKSILSNLGSRQPSIVSGLGSRQASLVRTPPNRKQPNVPPPLSRT